MSRMVADSNEYALQNASPPSLDLQATLDAELAMEAAYDRKLAALTELKGLAMEAAKALKTVDKSTIISELEFTAEEWEKFVVMCLAIKDMKEEIELGSSSGKNVVGR